MAAGTAPASASDHAWAWGNGDWGQLGNGVDLVIEGSEVVASPAGVCAAGTEGPCPTGPFLEGVTAISAGDAHSLALLSDGTVVAWGENELGQLGDGTYTGPGTCGLKGRVEVERVDTKPCSPTPVAVSGLSGVTATAAGGAHSLALLSDGTVMAWGANSKGQLGDKSHTSSDVPVAVPGLSHVTAIAAGGAYSLALLNDGTVMAWGDNESGQLGDGTTDNSDVPVPVSGLGGVVTAIAAATGGSHSLALLSSGAVMAWGANGEGQLGDGSTKGSDVPVYVSGLGGVSAVAAGEASSLALLSDGTVMSWGANGGGQLGIGGREEINFPHEMLAFSNVPVQVCAVGVDPVLLCHAGPFLSGASAISAGSGYEMAVLEASNVGWGNDCYGGSFGCEPIDFPFIPEALPGELGLMKLISAGYRSNLAFGPPLPTVARIYPTVGLDEGGESVTITGTELSEATAVHFGSVSAPSFTVNSESSITAVTPPETTGVVPVTVTTPAGTTPVLPGKAFHYIAAFPLPTVKRMVPTNGPAAGGTSVFITGSGFFGGSVAVHFGAASATSVTVNEIPSEPEANSITAVAPPGTGDVAVTVTTLGGPASRRRRASSSTASRRSPGWARAQARSVAVPPSPSRARALPPARTQPASSSGRPSPPTRNARRQPVAPRSPRPRPSPQP